MEENIKYPCLKLDCDKDAIYSVIYEDSSGTYACEEHVNQAKSYGLCEVVELQDSEEG